jgi:hypothetical protein
MPYALDPSIPGNPIGQFFQLRGRRYQEIALILASDEDRNGTSFQGQTEVLPDPFASNGPKSGAG